jgi:hypothetical protein
MVKTVNMYVESILFRGKNWLARNLAWFIIYQYPYYIMNIIQQLRNSSDINDGEDCRAQFFRSFGVYEVIERRTKAQTTHNNAWV